MKELTDQEIIRKAVELAPGFSLDANGTGWFDELGRIMLWADGQYPTEQWILDALAAELVRMVRQVVKERKRLGIWINMRHAVMGKSLDDDLTMNTLRCIVESKVLEGEE